MHEFSLSSEIVKTVLKTAEENKAKKVHAIYLEIGELALINKDQVAFWVEELLKDSIAEGAKVKVKVIKGRIRCGGCGYSGAIKGVDEGDFVTHAFPQLCPACGSFKVQIEKGRECFLRKIEAER
jgi:hydrogenase nickel incorporation protein HypA/HybF